MKEKITLAVPGDWFQVDFHVHSPCSFDYEANDKSESEYIKLLENAISSEIDIIVITDHNDIAGYQKFIDIKNDLLRTKKTLERTNAEIPEIVNFQFSLFEKIVIFPGVELDIYPNIHLLLIFNPQYIDLIDDFLQRAGFSQDVRGDETSSKYHKWSIEEALQEAEKIDAIVIAAHIDSDKGLYEASKKWGQSRISAFCNERLYGMEFINPISKAQIESIMCSPDYKRNTKLAFVQSSDFHGKHNQKIGERRTHVRMDNLDKQDLDKVFLAIKKALRNPDEFISAPGRPELQEILRNLVDEPFVENINIEEDKQKFIRLICAVSNTDGGTIIIGKNSKGNWIGQPEANQLDFEEKIKSLLNQNISPLPDFSLHVYPYSKNNYISTIQIRKSPQFYLPKNEDHLYLLRNGQPVRAQINEIINIAETRLIERYSHLSITNKISAISKNLSATEDSIDILPIVRKIDLKTTPLNLVLGPPKIGYHIDDEESQMVEFDGNGYTQGNVIVLSFSRPRFSEHYLRVTAPFGLLKETNIGSFKDVDVYDGEKIIIVPGGGVYYDNNEDVKVLCDFFTPYILVNDRKETETINFKFLVAFLKSSVSIWYSHRCLGTYDIRKSIIRDIPIPINVEDENIKEAVNLIDKIVSLEKDFLITQQNFFEKIEYKDIIQSKELLAKSSETVRAHNKKVYPLMCELDKLFYDLFNLKNTEINLIEKTIKSAGLAIFSKEMDERCENM